MTINIPVSWSAFKSPTTLFGMLAGLSVSVMAAAPTCGVHFKPVVNLILAVLAGGGLAGMGHQSADAKDTPDAPTAEKPAVAGVVPSTVGK